MSDSPASDIATRFDELFRAVQVINSNLEQCHALITALAGLQDEDIPRFKKIVKRRSRTAPLSERELAWRELSKKFGVGKVDKSSEEYKAYAQKYLQEEPAAPASEEAEAESAASQEQ